MTQWYLQGESGFQAYTRQDFKTSRARFSLSLHGGDGKGERETEREKKSTSLLKYHFNTFLYRKKSTLSKNNNNIFFKKPSELLNEHDGIKQKAELWAAF